jgi:glucan phosphorylase
LSSVIDFSRTFGLHGSKIRRHMSPEDRFERQLTELSMNLWWSWNPATIKLFRDLDPEGFRASRHNALKVVKSLPRERLGELSRDAVLRARVDRAHREFRAYMSPQAVTWASTEAAPLRVRPVAYLSAEFGPARVAAHLQRRSRACWPGTT